MTNIADDGRISDKLHQFVDYCFGIGHSTGDGSSVLINDVECVHPQLDQVVDYCEKGSQREGGHKQRDQTVLNNWEKSTSRSRLLLPSMQNYIEN